MTFGMHKWVDVLPSERAALRLGFAFHFCVPASYTPAEIALAVMADIVWVINGVSRAPL